MNELMTVDEALAHAQRLNVITPTGLQLPEHMKPVDYYAIGIQLTMAEVAAGWGRADLAARIKLDFPDSFRNLWREIWPLLSVGTLENDVLTACHYGNEERYRWTVEDGLSYGHCQKAGHLEIDYREDVLRMARDNGWSVRQLENYIITGSPDRGALPAPSRDVRKQYETWVETVPLDYIVWNVQERELAEYYVEKFIDYIERN